MISRMQARAGQGSTSVVAVVTNSEMISTVWALGVSWSPLDATTACSIKLCVFDPSSAASMSAKRAAPKQHAGLGGRRAAKLFHASTNMACVQRHGLLITSTFGEAMA